jgi:hypothetical protein
LGFEVIESPDIPEGTIYMINHPFDRYGIPNPNLGVGRINLVPTRPDVMQPNPFPFGTHHQIPTREQLEQLVERLIAPQIVNQMEEAVNDTDECACDTDDDFDDEPVIFLTVDEAMFVHEILQAAFMGALVELADSPSQMITLGLSHLRGKIDEVQSVIEEQLEAAEAL